MSIETPVAATTAAKAPAAATTAAKAPAAATAAAKAPVAATAAAKAPVAATMAAKAPVAATMAVKGTSAGYGAALSGVGTGLKAFVLLHPVSLATTGGILLGLGAYYAMGRWRQKPVAEAEETATA